MKKEFQEYLIAQGYSERSSSGKKSTVYDYGRRVDEVCKHESLTWNDLPKHINRLVDEYSVGGAKENFGAKSHNAVISALNRFYDYVHYLAN